MKKLILIISLLCLPVMAQDFNNVKYMSNYDGDTIKFDIGPSVPEIFRFMPTRLYGIDTPEIKSKNPVALLARNFVKSELKSAKCISLKDCKGDKYFRLNCQIEYDGKNLTQELLKRNYGYEYYGGTKRK